MTRYYTYDRPFTLESGETLPSVTIAYDTYGEMNSTRSNVIWVCHALTANSDVADWWPHTVERGKFLDPDRYFTVCANFLGSHYGTTGPLSINPAGSMIRRRSFLRRILCANAMGRGKILKK